MKLTWHGHSCFSLEFGSNKILIDPFLKESPVFDSANFDEVIKGTTHIALTHGHFDHLGDSVEIAKTCDAMLIANYEVCMWLAKKGVEKINPAVTGGTLHQSEFSVTFVHAQHSSAFIDEEGISHSLGNANGLVFHIEGEKSIYFMGDTDIFGDMALINELHQPQIGVVPIGDRFTMGSAVAALTCDRYFNFEHIIPCHFASFEALDKNSDSFKVALGQNASKLATPSIGEAFEL
ncbi:MAG: metal-dependent hydrolase [Nitratireductor sp.]